MSKKQPIFHGIRTSNLAERIFVEQMHHDGWLIIKRGWPDFLLVKNGSIRFVEVKQNTTHELSQSQSQVANILNHHFGIIVERWIP